MRTPVLPHPCAVDWRSEEFNSNVFCYEFEITERTMTPAVFSDILTPQELRFQRDDVATS
eukprot:7837761-Pyramimonas_sp.AAC.1